MSLTAAQKIMDLIKKEIRPLDVIKKENFDNVVRYMMATGGSTNSVLHIPAIARQAGLILRRSSLIR